MAGYSAETPPFSEDEIKVLRLSDPGFVAAGLAAIHRGAGSLVAPVLLRTKVALPPGSPDLPHDTLPFSEFVGTRADYKVSSDGTVSEFKAEDLVQSGPFVTTLGVTLQLDRPLHTASESPPWAPESRPAGYDNLVAWVKSALSSEVRVELPPLVGPLLNFSVPSIHARPADLPPLPRRDGRGVIIGVVDWGCDFMHPAFRHPDGSTRLRYLWDQNSAVPPATTGIAGPFGLGRLFDAAVINDALGTTNPYFALDYNPTVNLYRDERPVHGTHVLSVVAGSHAKGVPPGVAPGADLIFVHLRPNAVPTNTSASNGWTVLAAVLWIFAQADRDNQPAVVNLSIGTNRGPHDGSSILELGFDWLLNLPGRTIVVPAGNAYDAHLHANGTITPGGDWSIRWRFKLGDTTVNALDIWYESPTLAPTLLTTVIAPDGSEFVEANPGWPMYILQLGRLIGTVTTGVWWTDAGPPFVQQIHIELSPARVTDETWKIRLSLPMAPGQQPVTVDAWVGRDDLGSDSQSSIAVPEADRLGTLASLSCGRKTLCVGAYYEIPHGQPIAEFSSAGPTRDGRGKPDVVAPGYQVLAANALGGQRIKPDKPERYPLLAAMSGTSVSVAHVSGLAALMLQTRPGATADQIAALIRAWTQLAPPTFVPPVPPRNWDARFGYGRIDAATILWHQP